MDMLRLYARTLKVVEPIAEANQHKAGLERRRVLPVYVCRRNNPRGTESKGQRKCPKHGRDGLLVRYLWTSWAES